MVRFLSLLAASVLSAPAHRTAAGCLRYEPDTVALTGKLVRRMFYGAPNFGEDTKHDAQEIGFYLQLASPVCTLSGKDDNAATGVLLVQLVLDSAGYARLRPMLDHTVTLRGTLFAAITGHHHTPILLTVVKPLHVGLRRGSDLTNAEAVNGAIDCSRLRRELLLDSFAA